MSFCGSGKYFAAASLVAFARSRKMFQSVFDSHTGAMAADSGWMKEWRSVLLRSAFSYQEAAGRTMSEYSADESMRKFRSTIEVHLPDRRELVPHDLAGVVFGVLRDEVRVGAQVVLQGVLMPLHASHDRVATPDVPHAGKFCSASGSLTE